MTDSISMSFHITRQKTFYFDSSTARRKQSFVSNRKKLCVINKTSPISSNIAICKGMKWIENSLGVQ